MSWGVLLFACAVVITAADAGNSKKKEVSGLYPFPRVGRSDGYSVHSICKDILKRQGLIPFPRVGRDFQYRDDKNQNGGGLWFGPRLGRSSGTWSIPITEVSDDDNNNDEFVDYIKPSQLEVEKSLEEPLKQLQNNK